LEGIGKAFYPHELLRTDFNQIHEEAKRQEKIHPFNTGEFEIAKNVYRFFDGIVIPSILKSDWVFESAQQFAENYALAYFHTLRLIGEQTVNWQNRLLKLKDKVLDLLARFSQAGRAPKQISTDLAKASDFVNLLFWANLTNDEKLEANELHKETIDHEDLHLTLTLRNIGDVYEMGLPRVFFVIKRAMKENKGLEGSKSDKILLPPSDYIDWFVNQSNESHDLFQIVGNATNRQFFKVARNVRGHHRGLKWDRESNLVILEDLEEKIAVHIHDFSQKHRLLDYLCTYGMRAILAAFCERDQGKAAMRIYMEYEKLFPPGFPSGEGRGFKPYSI